MPGRVLIVKHVAWEGPHLIADALTRAGFDLDVRNVLTGDELPPRDEVAAAVVMGGPMNVDQTDQYPGLQDERAWLAAAAEAGLPMIGVCLGAQLIARALGAEVRPGGAPEIGWATVEIHDAEDPLARHLAPSAHVLHWHGDVFELPPGATLLASNEATEVQAFRVNNAWGFLFHAEADLALTQLWIDEPSMLAEAEAALGPHAARMILADAEFIDGEARERAAACFGEFARVVAEQTAN